MIRFTAILAVFNAPTALDGCVLYDSICRGMLFAKGPVLYDSIRDSIRGRP